MFEPGQGAMNTAAIQVHELYSSYLRAGFTEDQAFELTRLSIMAVNNIPNGGA